MHSKCNNNEKKKQKQANDIFKNIWFYQFFLVPNPNSLWSENIIDLIT